MKTKILLLLFFASIVCNVFAQVKIGDNPTTINGASLLELESTNQGFVLPRVALTNVTTASPLAAGLLNGTMVYSTTNPAGGSGIGLYYWDGAKWNFIANASTSIGNAWSITGNSGTTPSTAPLGSIVNNNFLGTTDPKDFVIASNNLERLRITSAGNIGIGTQTPASSALLQLNSTTQGLSLPTMITAQRNLISSPVTGLTIYNTTTGCLEFYVSGNWQPIGCGCTAKPAAPSSIVASPTGTICPNTTVSYSISDVPTATSYTWTYSGSLGTGGTFTGGTTTQINVTYGSNPTAGNWSVTATNACGTSTATTYAVTLTPVPSTPGTITQSPSGTVCPGQTGITFTIAAVSNATTYNWTVPAGATITSGAGTTSITVTCGATAGNVSVTATGCNGTSAASSLAVSFPAAPATPGTITPNPTTYCPGATVTYSITAVAGATTYTWTVPSGSNITAGQGTTSITVTVGSTAGNVTVTAGNCAANSAASSLAINPGHGTLYYSYTGSDQTFTVPSCVTAITVKLWSAGGGAFGPFLSGGGYGGGGGFVGGVLTVTGGSSIKVIVGGGGNYLGTASYGNGTGGGNGGKGNAFYGTGSGGGRSALQITSGTDAVTAGGGGGGGFNYTNGYGNGGGGGASNGTTGRNIACDALEYGALGTVLAGGAGGSSLACSGVSTYNGGSGSLYTGGNVSASYNYPGGGGGGGYYGGGAAGNYYGSGGGGGSNYPAATIPGTFTLTLSSAGGTEPNPSTSINAYALAANPGDADYINYTTNTGGYIGRGGTGTYIWNPASTGDNNYFYGGNGYIVISW